MLQTLYAQLAFQAVHQCHKPFIEGHGLSISKCFSNMYNIYIYDMYIYIWYVYIYDMYIYIYNYIYVYILYVLEIQRKFRRGTPIYEWLEWPRWRKELASGASLSLVELHQGEIGKVGTEQHTNHTSIADAKRLLTKDAEICRACFNNTCAKIGPGCSIVAKMPVSPHDDSGRCSRLVITLGWVAKKYCHSFRMFQVARYPFRESVLIQGCLNGKWWKWI